MFDGPIGPVYSCDYTGAVTVNIEGELWARTWWSTAGDTVTDFTPSAKASFGTWDSQFDNDYAAWLASLPPPAPPCPHMLMRPPRMPCACGRTRAASQLHGPWQPQSQRLHGVV